jgi:ribonuclease HI
MSDLIQIYTDGACVPNPGRGGWGFVVVEGGYVVFEHYGGEIRTTNNCMEMTAIIEAMQWIPGGLRAVVYSDSDYCVKVITGRWKAKKNLGLVKRARKLLRHTKTELRWIKGHNGNRWNEKADELAGKGVRLTF